MRKIRAILKAILHSLGPCSHHDKFQCSRCPKRKGCLFFNYMINDRLPRPYVIHIEDPGAWQGLMTRGEERSFDIHLVGSSKELNDWFSSSLILKSRITLDAAGGKRAVLELSSIQYVPDSRAVGVNDLLSRYEEEEIWGGNKILAIGIEFLTPVEMRKGGRLVDDPYDMTFELFLKALFNRFTNLARVYCGVNDPEIPRFEDYAPSARYIVTGDNTMTFVSRKPRQKDHSHGWKSPEYVGGLKGFVSFKGDITPYFPAIVLGEALHVGRKITQGLGQYRIEWLEVGPL